MAYCGTAKGGENMKQTRRKFFSAVKKFAAEDNAGMGVIEIILIIVVLISLVLIFKTQLTALVRTIFGNISNSALSV